MFDAEPWNQSFVNEAGGSVNVSALFGKMLLDGVSARQGLCVSYW